jgi:hypothetical protein
MAMVDTSTAIMARLLVRFEGNGFLMASVAYGLAELVGRLQDPDVVGSSYVAQNRRLHFCINNDAVDFVRDVRNIPPEVLWRDQVGLREVLGRLGVSGFTLNPLLMEEFKYLEQHVGEGPWCRHIPIIAEDLG